MEELAREGDSYVLIFYRNAHPLPPSLLFSCLLNVAILLFVTERKGEAVAP